MTGSGDISNDIRPVVGITTIPNKKTNGKISISILPDNSPELTETFKVFLTQVDNGADISNTNNASTFMIK